MKIVITGGHHNSALPVIDILKKENAEIYWFGHRHSLKGSKADTLEYKEITALNIPFVELSAGKFYKTYDPIRLLKIPFGFFQAFYYLLKIRPKAILSFGGYLAVPVILAGWVLGIPSVTHEQTVVLGWANKLISKFAKKILISWEESEKYFPKNKVVYTGIPLRESVFASQSNHFDVNKKLPTIYITGGKTGAHKINEFIGKILMELLEVCNVIHQCGEHSVHRDDKKLEEIYKNLEEKPRGKYFIRTFVFEDEIGEVFEKADLVVSRAGAHIINELLALEKPCILIPIPWVSHNEQYKNAKVLEEYGLAEILAEKDLTPENFLGILKGMLSDLGRYKLNDKNARELLKKDSAKLIADEVFKISRT